MSYILNVNVLLQLKHSENRRGFLVCLSLEIKEHQVLFLGKQVGLVQCSPPPKFSNLGNIQNLLVIFSITTISSYSKAIRTNPNPQKCGLTQFSLV